MRLLIVDDSRTMRSMLSSYAHDLKCETVEAEDGQAALDLLQTEGPFDAALLDWDMPRMDGFACLKHIRAEPEYDAMKILMVTSQNSFERVSSALAAGADDYLMKPLDEEMLADKLRLLGIVA